MLVLNEGGSGGPATSADALAYAQTINATFPVLADGGGQLAAATPITGKYRPELCVLAPDMTILECATGHNKVPGLLDSIKAHAGLL